MPHWITSKIFIPHDEAIVLALDDYSSIVEKFQEEDDSFDYMENNWNDIVAGTQKFLEKCRQRICPSTFLMIMKFSGDIEPEVFICELGDEIPPDTWKRAGSHTQVS